jgi:hypothetical protein
MLKVRLTSHAAAAARAARRQLLRVGSLSALGLSLPRLLAAEAARGDDDVPPRARSVILVYLGGGLSHHDSFDLKPDAPEEVRGKYQPISSRVPDLQVGELLPRMADVMDRMTLLRCGAHNNDHHETATNWVLCGRFGSAFGDYPAMGAVVSHELGFRGALPPYVAIPRNPSFTWELGRSAFLGGRYESFKVGDPNGPGFRVRDVALAEALARHGSAARRREFLAAIDGLAERVRGNDQVATFDQFHQRAADILSAPEAQAAFDIEREEPRLRDRYGRTTFGQSCLLARRLVEGGVRFATVNFGGWDHHSGIWPSLDRMLPEFDQGLSALIEDLDDKGLLAETLVAAFGEFGRTPKINKDAGRDHWAPAASLLFAGAGVPRGQVVGATDAQGAYVSHRPVAPADVAATIFDLVGIDPRRQLVTPDGRPIEILDSGEPVRELYG